MKFFYPARAVGNHVPAHVVPVSQDEAPEEFVAGDTVLSRRLREPIELVRRDVHGGSRLPWHAIASKNAKRAGPRRTQPSPFL